MDHGLNVGKLVATANQWQKRSRRLTADDHWPVGAGAMPVARQAAAAVIRRTVAGLNGLAKPTLAAGALDHGAAFLGFGEEHCSMTRYFQITSLPPGEAPADIQTAWIGCVMPLFDRRVSGVRRGVLTRQRLPNRLGYTVRVLDALAVLERHSPAAAQWWREHTPYLIRPGKLFFFALESCRLCDASACAAVEPADALVWPAELDDGTQYVVDDDGCLMTGIWLLVPKDGQPEPCDRPVIVYPDGAPDF